MSREPRIFQIGFNKCATRSLSDFMAGNGLPVVHWHGGALARRAKRRMRANEDPFADYEGKVFFSDMEDVRKPEHIVEFYKNFRYIHEWYPNSYYILNTRDVNDWLKSRMRTKQYIERYEVAYQTRKPEIIFMRWREDWENHHAAVREFFRDKAHQFLEYDIDRDKPDDLVAFLAKDFTLRPIPMKSIGSNKDRHEIEQPATS